MIKLVWDNAFKRLYKKKITYDVFLKKKFWDALYLFEANPFDARLKTHKLTGKLVGSWAFSITYDCRVVFRFYDNNKTVLLVDIGSHDEVYQWFNNLRELYTILQRGWGEVGFIEDI